MKRSMKKRRWLAPGLIGVLVLALGLLFCFCWPVYPDFQQKVDSAAQLREKLDNAPEAEHTTVVELSKLGGEETKWSVWLDGRMLSSKPCGYSLRGRGTTEGVSYELLLSCKPAKETELNLQGAVDRGAVKKLTVQDSPTSPSRRVLRLEILWDAVYYETELQYPKADSEAQLQQDDAAITALAARLTDLILEG